MSPSQPLFDVRGADELAAALKSDLKAPYVSARKSTLGGDENVSVMLVVSLDPRESWLNGILQNSRYFHMSIDRNGTINRFGGYGVPKFRKSRAKSVADVVARINKYIAEAK